MVYRIQNELTDFAPRIFSPGKLHAVFDPGFWQPAFVGLGYLIGIMAMPVLALILDRYLQSRRKDHRQQALNRVESLLSLRRYDDAAMAVKEVCCHRWEHPEIMYMNGVQFSDFLYTQQGENALDEDVCEWVFHASEQPGLKPDEKTVKALTEWLIKL